MRVLIVDDSKTMRMIVKRTLRQAGYNSCEVDEAGNGKEAIEVIKASRPNVILCDWNMPEMNGLELLQALNAQGDKIPFGFVTSEGTPEMKQLAMNNGALFLITKPFTPEMFQQELKQVLS